MTGGFSTMRVLGDAALLATPWPEHFVYLIADGQVQAVEGLNGHHQQAVAGPQLWSAGGTWPDNTWMALSSISDAGPSSSWLYKWRPKSNPGDTEPTDGSAASIAPLRPDGGWQLMKQYGHSVGPIVPWQGGVVMVDISPHIGADRIPYSAFLITESGTSSFSGGCVDLPWWTRDGVLFGFGIDCEVREDQKDEVKLLLTQWHGTNKPSIASILLPQAPLYDSRRGSWEVRIEGDDLLILGLPAYKSSAEIRLLRWKGKEWLEEDVPKGFQLLGSENGALYGLVGRQLVRWYESEWQSVGHLEMSVDCGVDPNDSKLWQRDADDIWLLACGSLFNSAGGSSTVELPSDADSSAFIDKRRKWDDSCSHTVVDVFTLSGEPINGDPWSFSSAQARALLRKRLKPYPQYKSLEFLQYDCFGHDCIAAVVPDEETGTALREAIESYKYDISYATPLFCGSHPESRPFKVF